MKGFSTDKKTFPIVTLRNESGRSRSDTVRKERALSRCVYRGRPYFRSISTIVVAQLNSVFRGAQSEQENKRLVECERTTKYKSVGTGCCWCRVLYANEREWHR